jgi:hypothetical protein
MKIEFGRPMLDWITLTSYKNDLARKGTAILSGLPDPISREIICYTGMASDSSEGGCFVGTGEQGGKYHCMLQLSGPLADRLGPMLIGGHEVGEGVGRAARIDLQITIAEALDLDALAGRLVGETRSQITIYRTLQGGRVGDTLYIGSPKSDKRTRIYHKANGTRYEIQFRRDYASSIAEMIRDTGGRTVQQVVAGILYGEVISSGLRDPALRGIENVLDGWCHGIALRPTSNGRAVGDRERWLRKVVMGALVAECSQNEDLRTEVLSRLLKCSRETGEIYDV